ncbi:hypothetical protein [Bacteroides propionicifaciens]|jgi:N-acetylglucosamine kinase-like BadF-type ATPase|uniref:hypothetical protein n=1 Tax=Bacteroides propionicifaciens TaxID=392838 RepID=UPI00036B42EE|nr:hypothetical protein [Bacteroides propionicifaciens]
MILIAESSSTRTEWAVVDRHQVVNHIYTEGINPFFQSRREISRSIRLNLPEEYFRKKFETVYFYGAGCNSKDKSQIVEASLVAQFKTPVEVESDLLAAARGLFLDNPGIACILGTGSNSCFYDGNKIVKNVTSGGYILGDEGSGAVLGKYFLSDVLKEVAPKELIELFYDTFRITPAMAMESVYQMPFPNRFLATVAYFLSEHMDDDYVYNMVECNLERFFERNITQYDYQAYPIRMMGSSAVLFRAVINNIAEKFGAKVDKIDESAIHGLVEYHS